MQQCVVLPAERACCPDYIVELVLPTGLVNREQTAVYSVLYIEWDVVILRFLNTRVHTVGGVPYVRKVFLIEYYGIIALQYGYPVTVL